MKRYWLKVADRAARTVAQAAISLLGANELNWLTLDWLTVAKVSLTAGLLSLLMSIMTSGIGATDDPGFI